MAPSSRPSSHESPSSRAAAPAKDGCEDDADCGESDGGCCGKPEGLDGCAEPGIEEDDGKHQRAEHIGQWIIGEFYAEAIHTSPKADHQEKQEERRAEAEGDKARKGGDENENGCDQQQKIK